MFALAGGLIALVWTGVPEELRIAVVVYATVIATMAYVVLSTIVFAAVVIGIAGRCRLIVMMLVDTRFVLGEGNYSSQAGWTTWCCDALVSVDMIPCRAVQE